MVPAYTKVHNRFKYNGIHYNQEALKDVAYSLIKEGESFEKHIGNFLLDWLDEKDHLYISTSGSTGIPKPIKTSKQAMVNSAIRTGNFFGLEPGDTALHCLPTSFVAGKMMLIRAFTLGLEIDVVEPLGQPVFDTEKRYKFSGMVPYQLNSTFSYINNINHLIVGGARIPNHLRELILDIPTKVYETFGMTETITHIALKPVNKAAGEAESFKVLEDVKVSLDDRNCLVIDAPHITDAPIVTNDIVNLFSDSEFEWLGRFDNVINSGGVKLNPEQIESKLSKEIQSRFFITSQFDENLGEKVVLVLEAETNSLTDTVFEGLDKYEVPKEVKVITQFRDTDTGKINRPETLKLLN
jgi:O-succinylbenzoic acid--CoA ligase